MRDGVVRHNGEVAALGAQTSAGDRITVRGYHYRVQAGEKRPRVLMYHKPEGEITTRKDEQNRQTVFDRLPHLKNARWVAVGRLDINTTGLLLLTTDGELANALMHPSSEVEREYAVRVFGHASDQQLKAMRDGVDLDGSNAAFDRIVDAGGQGRNRWYHVTLREGKNREVRRLWQSQDLTVSRLMRVRYGPVSLPKWLKPGKWRDLSSQAVQSLIESSGVGGSGSELLLKPAKPGKKSAKR